MSIRPPSLRITTPPSLLWGVLLSVGLLFGAVGASHGQTADAPWPGFAAGADNASLSPFGATSSTFQASIGDITAPSAVSAAGDVYVKYESGGNVNLYRIVPDGGAGTAQIASFGAALANQSEEDGTAQAIGPVIGAEGRVYVVAPGGESRALYRVDTQSGDAETPIFAPSEATFSGEPAIDPATQTLYVPLTDGRIVVLQPDGTVVNTFRTLSEAAPTAPLVDPSGRVIYSTAGGTIEAIDEGTQIELFDVTRVAATAQPLSPAAYVEGILYVTSRAPNNENPETLYAINEADGSLRFEYPLTTTIKMSPPVVDQDGTVYVTARDESSLAGSLFAFTAEATSTKDPLWSVSFSGRPSMPALSPRGRVLVGLETSENGELRSYDPTSGTLNWTEVVPNTNIPKRYAPTILSDGAAVVGTSSAAYIVLGAIPDVSQSSVSFGGVEAGATYSRSITFENKGGSPFTFLSASASSPSGEYQVAAQPTDGTEFSPSQSESIQVEFSPAPNPSVPSESRDGTLTIRTSVGDLTVPLNALVNSPQLTATPDPIDFGTFDSQSTDTRNVDLQNTGAANLTISARTISGTNSDLFSLTSSSDGTITPSGSFTYTVEYNPNGATGSHTANLELTTAELGTILIPITAFGEFQEFTATPPSLFGSASIDVGSVTSETTTLEAPESSDVQVDQLLVVPDPNAGTDYSGDYRITSTGNTGQINSNGTKEVVLEFEPSGGGARPAILEVRTESRGTLEIPLQGTGLTYVLSPTPPSVDFGSFAVGQTDDPETVTIENTGTGTISGLSASLDNTTDFSIATAPGASLAPGETTTLELTFTPQSTGAKSATLTLTSDKADAQTVSVTGEGDDREISMMSDFTYAVTEVGQTTPKDLVIENTGSVTLSNLTASFGSSSEFAVTNVTPTSIAPGEQATISTTFTPSGDGQRTATLQVSADDSILSLLLGPYTTTFSASGEGVTYTLSSSGDLTFGDVAVSATSSGQDVTFTNTGSGTLTGLSASLADGTHFALTNDTAESTLAPGASRTVTVAFAPTSPGAQSTTLTMTAAEGASASAALNGFGADYNVTASPTSNDFGTVETGSQGGTQTFTFTNASNTSVSGVSVSLDNTTDFTITNDTGETTLEAGATRDVTVRFDPQTAGALSAALDVTTTEGASASATLNGFGGTYALTTSPTSVDFGGVKVGETATQTVTIENTGNDAVDLTGIAVSGTDAGRFTITSGGGLNTLAAGATQDVTLEYAPDAANGDAASLDVTGSNGTSATTSLSGSGQEGTISISPSPVSFPETEVGQTSASTDVTIENTGGASLTGVSATLTNTADFTITGDTGESDLAPGATRTVSVAFAPGTEGTLTGALDVASTEGISESTTLNGTGVTFSIAPGTTALDFGGVAVGSSAQQTVSIENTGSGNVDLTGFEITGADAAQFTITNGAESVTLTPGATQSVTVSYTPDAANADDGTLAVTGSDGTSATVSLRGTGQDGDLTLSTASVDFGVVEVGQASGTQDLTFTNSGNGDLENVAVSLSNTTDYTITNDTGEATLGPSQSRTVTVQFAPSTTGNTSATLQATADGGESLSASLSGFGATYSLATTPGSVDFGGVKIGTTVTQTVTIENTGNDAVDLTGIQLSGADASVFELTSGTGLSTLAPGATQDVTVAYTPPGTSPDAATLEVTGSNGTAASTSLSGNGTEGALSASASSLSFGSVPVGQTSSGQSVTLTNTGDASVTGVSVGLDDATHFTITNDTGETTLQPGEGRTVTVAFAPGTGGALATALTASTTEGASATVALDGTGATFVLSTSPTDLDFGGLPVGDAATNTVTIENTGTADVTSINVALSGTDTDQFALTSETSIAALAPGETQAVTVEYAPNEAQSHSVTLDVTGSDGTSASTTITGAGLDGTLEASATSLSFGAVEVGQTSGAQDVTFTNTGTASVSGVGVSLTNTTNFTITGDTGETTLAPSESRTVTVAFAPNASGSLSTTLVASTSEGTAASVSLSGTGTTTALTASTTTLDFGGVPLGTTATQTVTLENTGTVSLTLDAAQIRGPDASVFSIESGGGAQTLAPGATQDVTVGYTPPGTSPDAATLSVTSSEGPSVSVDLSGQGQEGALSASTSSLDFGTVDVGATSGGQDVIFTNTGDAPVEGVSVALSTTTDFSITNDTGETTLPPGASRTVTVAAAPSAGGDKTATLQASSPNAASASTSLTVFGAAPELTTTSSLDFGDVPLGSTAAQSITIQNTGNVPVEDVTATVQGTNATAFTVTSGSGPDTLATGAETSVTIEFTPSAVATETATLSIASATAATVEVALTGTGAPVPEGAFAASTVDFGTLATGTTATQTVALSSTGSAPLTVNDLSLSGADAGRFEIVTTDVGPIAAGETASLRVRFTPNAEGDASATLTADTDAGALTTSLTGAGVAVTLTVGTAQAGDPLPVSVAAPGFFDASGTYGLFVRPGGATAYTRLPLTGTADEVTASVPDTLVTVRGLDYYIVLENGAQSLALPKANAEASASEPAHQRVRFDEVTADGAFDPEAYRMISLPVQLDEAAVRGQLVDDYGEYVPTEWRLVQWEASAQRYRDVGASDALGAGAATWLVTKDGAPFTVGEGRSVTPDSVTVTVQPGWNQVSTPFAFPVRWADVAGREAVEAPVGFEDGAFQFAATTLKPWRGYFVFNPGTNAVDLVIPPVAAGSDAASEPETTPAMVASKASSAQASGDTPYTLQLSAHLDRLGLRDANNYVGFRPDASEGRDATDYADPPAVGSHVRLSVTENGETLAGSFRPTGTTGQAWDVAVSASVDESFQTDKTVRVTLRNVTGTLPSGYDRYVLDLDRERYVPTSGGTFTATLTPEQTTRRFRVVLGTEAFAQQASDGIPLRSYENTLAPNAPNPFSNETTLGYTLSEKRDVTIEIYNILGQRIRTMDLGEKSAGPHEVTWDGRTRYGQLAASGVYFYRIRAGDFVASKKMTLVR